MPQGTSYLYFVGGNPEINIKKTPNTYTGSMTEVTNHQISSGAASIKT